MARTFKRQDCIIQQRKLGDFWCLTHTPTKKYILITDMSSTLVEEAFFCLEKQVIKALEEKEKNG